jgi:hypothetical protein
MKLPEKTKTRHRIGSSPISSIAGWGKFSANRQLKLVRKPVHEAV